MNFSDIPQLTRSGSYIIDQDWNYLEEALERYSKNYNLDIDPEFQRAHVWDDFKRSRHMDLIERLCSLTYDIQGEIKKYGYVV